MFSLVRLCFISKESSRLAKHPNQDFRMNLLWGGHGSRPSTCRVRHRVWRGSAQVMPCVVSATQGLVRLAHVGGDYLSKLGGLPKCAGISRREMGIECILAAEMAGIFASHRMIFFFLMISLDEPSVLVSPPSCPHHHHHHYLSQRSGSYSPLAKSGLLPVFFKNKVLLKHS